MRYRFWICLMLMLGCRSTALAQQTIFNVPSAEVTPPGRVFVQHESQFKPWDHDRFVSNTEYAAVGVGHHTELDVTVFNANAPDTDQLSVGFGFKTAVPLLKERLPERELKLTVGTMVPVSLAGQGVGNWSYAHVSARLPRLNTRLTAGVSAGTEELFGRNTVHAIAGVEQPFSKRISVMADWYSGTHNLGLLITGISVALPHDTNAYLGYQIPNTERSGKGGFVVELSKLLF